MTHREPREKSKRGADRSRRRFRLFGRGKNRRIGAAAKGQKVKGPDGNGETESPASLAAKKRAAERKTRRRERRNRRLRALWGSTMVVSRAVARVIATVTVLAACGFGAHYGYRALMRSTYFDVDSVTFTGTRNALPSELRRAIKGLRGQSIFKVDRHAVRAALAAHPWVKDVEVQRVLPRSIRISVVERRAKAAVLMGRIYLLDSDGLLFKAATADEAQGLVLITGVERQQLQKKAPQVQSLLRAGLSALQAYHRQPRPALSELHLGPEGEVTLFLRKSGTALRFGKALSAKRLAQLDAVWLALGTDASRARALYLDHEVRRNRVVVRMNPTSPQ